MTRLATDQPEVYDNFMAGYFSVQLSGESPFGRIPVDQTTQITVNKDTKTTGGTTKFSLKTIELLRHSLGPLPWALATPEGFPRKTNKAALATYLQKDIPSSTETIPHNAVTVIDGMNLVQKLNVGSNQTTFGSIATAILSMALHEGSKTSRIDVVFNTYKKNSIENAERSLLGKVLKSTRSKFAFPSFSVLRRPKQGMMS